ncbi:phosphatase PAP2 family protein [Cohnella thermotolerans]|uniref:phosphatase PAP2 family protein n=1 Tax=Cohnella thermotolerans TaxID=329858 RepID=UPI0003FC5BED|nr:phosphatase PAP2 family protein [Cohnella thermotolerans]
MAAFDSMMSIVVYSVIAVALLLWFGTGRHPLAPAGAFVKSLVTSPMYLGYFLAMLAILILNKFELKLEALFPVSYNLTRALSGWEGSWQGDLQRYLHSDALTLVCAFFYLVSFQSTLVASIGIYTYERNFKLYYALCVAVLLNYLIALPFFLFVPVDEAWFVSPQIHFLMLDAFPRFEADYRPLSGLDNCFPSLHTSLSVTMALLAARSGNRRWALFAAVNAVTIVFSIFYLGIHWFTDMIGGLCLAAAATAIGLKVGERADRRRSALDPDKTGFRRKWFAEASRSSGS